MDTTPAQLPSWVEDRLLKLPFYLKIPLRLRLEAMAAYQERAQSLRPAMQDLAVALLNQAEADHRANQCKEELLAQVTELRRLGHDLPPSPFVL